jgi:hypothetical protein
MPTSSHTWPFDVLQTAAELPRHAQDHLICFLACPFQPRDRADQLVGLVQTVCNAIGQEIGAQIECIRADKISTPGTIHSDIWRYIQLADALVFDVTGLNGNVLLELGVAAAARPLSSVVILRDAEDQSEDGRFLFDLAPTRHLLYHRSVAGSPKFVGQLKEALLHAITPAPYVPTTYVNVCLPLTLDLRGHGDPDVLLSPPASHRRPSADGLEFGSLFVFRNSWLSVGREDYTNVSVKVKLKMSQRHPNLGPADGWIGVSLCSSHFFANYSHLVYVKSDGSLVYTEPQSESTYVDRPWGQLTEFNPFAPVEISVSLSGDALTMEVDGTRKCIATVDMPYRRHAGKVRLQTHLCRAVLEHLAVDSPHEACTREPQRGEAADR